MVATNCLGLSTIDASFALDLVIVLSVQHMCQFHLL